MTQKESLQTPQLTEVYEAVFDLGTYTTLDEAYARNFYAQSNDNWGGGCTAVAKKLEDGTTLVGRNMDLNITDKGAYIFRTQESRHYRTVGLSYTFRDISPDCAQIREAGISDDFRKRIPFMADDVLNEKGLSIELNMRPTKLDIDGNDCFANSGTNPDAQERVNPMIRQLWLEECAEFQNMNRQERMDVGYFWEITFTEVVNCQRKTLFVRFFEDNSKTVTLDFSE